MSAVLQLASTGAAVQRLQQALSAQGFRGLVCFDAPVIDLVKDEETKVGHLGPDILAPTWSAHEVIARARRKNDTAIGELLLDQRVTAGIGNVYRCEALWWRRVNPWGGRRRSTVLVVRHRFLIAGLKAPLPDLIERDGENAAGLAHGRSRKCS